jgi:hypothetical protein
VAPRPLAAYAAPYRRDAEPFLSFAAVPLLRVTLRNLPALADSLGGKPNSRAHPLRSGLGYSRTTDGIGSRSLDAIAVSEAALDRGMDIDCRPRSARPSTSAAHAQNPVAGPTVKKSSVHGLPGVPGSAVLAQLVCTAEMRNSLVTLTGRATVLRMGDVRSTCSCSAWSVSALASLSTSMRTRMLE